MGEAPGRNEEIEGLPFVGAAGFLMNSMFQEIGLNRYECFITNVSHQRPPGDDIDLFFLNKTTAKAQGCPCINGRYPAEPIRHGLARLYEDIGRANPRLIIAFGNTALWALTGHTGIMKWRGSEFDALVDGRPIILIPTIHPAAILRSYSDRPLAVHDLRKAKRDLDLGGVPKTAYNFHLRPTLSHAMQFMREAASIRERGGDITADTETRGHLIACLGIAISNHEAMSIPLMCVEGDRSYWSPSEELEVVLAARALLSMPVGGLTWQNAFFDSSMTVQEWALMPATTDDTMIGQHTCFPGMPKRLDFLSSLHCNYHMYWKDDGKHWDPKMPEEQLWAYNCEDCVRTDEIRDSLRNTISVMRMQEQYQFQMSLLPVALEIGLRGFNIDHAYKKKISDDLAAGMRDNLATIKAYLGHDFNPRSHPAMKKLFYEDFLEKPVFNRKTKGVTVDDTALVRMKRRSPLLAPLIDQIQEYRSRGVFKSTFADARCSPDGRMRTSVNLTGAETFRFSTSEAYDGSGTNLQNISKGTADD